MSLGHFPNDFSNDALFRMHIKDAMGWLLSIPTAVADYRSEQVLLWPNPASNVVYFNRIQPNTTVILLDATGRIVHQQRTTHGQNQIDLNDLAPGSYFIQVDEKFRTRVSVVR